MRYLVNHHKETPEVCEELDRPFLKIRLKEKDLCFTALYSLSFASKSVDSKESHGFGIMGISAGEKMISQTTF